MVRRIRVQILGLLTVLLYLCAWVRPSHAQTLIYTDKLSRTVRVSTPVERAVLVVTPEMIPALDLWNQVVGISDFAEKTCGVYKAFVHEKIKPRITTVGTGANLNIEALMKVNPDIIITWSFYPEVVKFLEERNLKVIAIWPENLEELYEMIRLYGRLFNREKRAQMVIEEMRKLLDFVRDRTKKIPHNMRKRALHITSKPTVISGKRSIINDVIEFAGGIHLGKEISERNADVSLEKIVKMNPDVIFIWGGAKYDESWIINNQALRHVKAVRERRIYKLPRWSTWSPKVPILALYVAQKMYPDQFKSVSFESKADEFYRKVFGINFNLVRMYEDFKL
ncbi:MAG: ABC transporter substrate-binding protein [Caldimicrobium sp.]|nr:ABC transporter substrate-binding protein [Caldimicrobium sp.]MCX7613560.1 ABC transporter substrate-binding protein [Caldimicrobium sp.]MDW8182262.1 ABC transporter substrate-binding protein [Caldimicrobium sp.]